MMAKRMILMLAVVITLLAGLGFVKYRQIQAAVAQNGNFQPPPEPVTTIVAQRENWPSTLNIIGTAEAINPIYVNFGVPQQTSAQLLGGRTVPVTSDDLPGAGFTGRVTAVNSVINAATRNIQVQATLSNHQGKHRPGMFVQVELRVGG